MHFMQFLLFLSLLKFGFSSEHTIQEGTIKILEAFREYENLEGKALLPNDVSINLNPEIPDKISLSCQYAIENQGHLLGGNITTNSDFWINDKNDRIELANFMHEKNLTSVYLPIPFTSFEQKELFFDKISNFQFVCDNQVANELCSAPNFLVLAKGALDEVSKKGPKENHYRAFSGLAFKESIDVQEWLFKLKFPNKKAERALKNFVKKTMTKNPNQDGINEIFKHLPAFYTKHPIGNNGFYVKELTLPADKK